jgi:ABC-type branched-subunit amino acid transport system ATPase component
MKNINALKPKLILENIYKAFGGVIAADEISLEVFPGQVFGLIGPNGSGKTTLLNIISGIYAADHGTIYLEDQDVTKVSIHHRAVLGISRTFQHPRLLDRCDIYTNIKVGIDLANKKRISNEEENNLLMVRLLDAAGLKNIDLRESVEKLSYGQQKLLEIVRAMLARPKMLLVDEPAAGLNRHEMEQIVSLFAVAKEYSIGLLIIEHAMDLIMSICDMITVLNFGHQIAMGTPAEIQNNPAVIDAYLGGSIDA